MKCFFRLLTIFGLSFTLTACDEKSWLKEEPLDFYSPVNSYSTESDFNAAVATLYVNVRNTLFDVNTMHGRAMHYPTDLVWCTIALAHDLNLYQDKLFPNSVEVQSVWSGLYQVIFNANAIIGRIDGDGIRFSSEEAKNSLKAEAYFFRAFAMRSLAILYGGVPIILDEITAPKRDFVRAGREEVWQQCVQDLLIASQNLPEITNVREEGRISKAVAFHLLSEVYISLKNWDAAIQAASAVIDNPNFSLMKERFGSKKNAPGDVYGDLFKRNNQNRSSGNREGLWVDQYEYLKPGGGNGNQMAWAINPFYIQLKDTEEVNLFIGPTTKNGGRPIGWLSGTDYMSHEIWARGSGDDIRNSEYNIIRDIKSDNPASKYYGQYIVASGAISKFPNTYNRWWSMIYAKLTPFNEDYPTEFITNTATGLVNNQATKSFTDSYLIRLAETYLLRAEAYMGKGDNGLAAADINVIRARAHATPASPEEMSIDYILDERARELHWEELRVMTLMRLGKMVERVRKYNALVGYGIADHQNLWPIPFREIETNTEAVLQQNPGYN